MGSDDTPDLDDFPVRYAHFTAAIATHESGGRLILHNHRDPCPAGQRIDEPFTARLGADVAPRTELKRLCKVCDWPDGAESALRRTPKRFRRRTGQ